MKLELHAFQGEERGINKEKITRIQSSERTKMVTINTSWEIFGEKNSKKFKKLFEIKNLTTFDAKKKSLKKK